VGLQQDVSHLEAATRLQYPEHFAQHPELLAAEIEDAIGDQEIDRRIGKRQCLDLA